jgi:hypothetical protein
MQPAAELLAGPLDLEIDIESEKETIGMEQQELVSKYGLSEEQWEACEKSAIAIKEKFAPALLKAIKDLSDKAVRQAKDIGHGATLSQTGFQCVYGSTR